MEKREYQAFITGLKGIACWLVFVGHFTLIYRGAQIMPFKMPLFDKLRSSPLGFLTLEGYWLYLFFVISGYLVAQKEIRSFYEMIKKVVLRFFRLAIPILFAYAIIYLLYLVVGFHNIETIQIFENNWYQSFYNREYLIIDVILSPIRVLIFGAADLNKPYWVLKSMFISSIIIYVLLYCSTILQKYKWSGLNFWLIISVTFASYGKNTIICSCLIGFLVSQFKRNQNELLKSENFFILVMLFWLGIYMMFRSNILTDTFLSSLFFACTLICIPKVRLFDKLLSSKIMIFLGKISWGIYSFHWPISCSVGAFIMLLLYEKIGAYGAYIIAFVTVSTVTIALAFIFNQTGEKWAEDLVKLIDTLTIKFLKIEDAD